MIYLALGALALVVTALVVSESSGSVGGLVSSDQLAHLAWGVGMISILIAASWRRLLTTPLRNLQSLAIWVLIGAVVIIGYSYRDRLKGVSSQVMGDLRPGLAVSGPGGTVTITRRSDGSFRVEGSVQGRTQGFLFDTGASSVVLTNENAAALGYRPRPDEFITRVWTANGSTRTAPVQLGSVTIGTITERNVDASIAQPGALDENLLGQTFLERLGSYEVRGDKLILTPRR